MLSTADSTMWFRMEPKIEMLDELFDFDFGNKINNYEVLDNVPFGDFVLQDYKQQAMKDKNYDPCLSSTLDSDKDIMWGTGIQTHRIIKPQPTQTTTTTTTTTQPKPFVPKNQQHHRSLLLSSLRKQQQQQMKYIRHDHSFSKQPTAIEDAKLKYETPDGSSEDDNSMDEVPSQYQQVLDFITSERQQALQLLSDLAQEECDNDLTDYLQGNFELGGNVEQMELDIKVEQDDEESSSESSSSESGSSSSSESEDSEDEDTEVPVVNNSMMFQDHAYHKPLEPDQSYMNGRNKNRLVNMGVDTPSDSEEEIDVINVDGDINQQQQQQNSRIHFKIPMPTNPSPLDRKSIQKTVATAIKRRNRQTPTKAGNQRNIQQHITIEHHQITPPHTPTGKARKKRNIQLDTTTAATPSCSSNRGRKPRQNIRQRRKRANGESDSDSESEKRNQHNNMERQRRVDLRHLFNGLRMSVPVLREKERAAKVAILRESKKLVEMLMAEEREYIQAKIQLKRHQDMLMGRVSSLRRILASKR